MTTVPTGATKTVISAKILAKIFWLKFAEMPKFWKFIATSTKILKKTLILGMIYNFLRYPGTRVSQKNYPGYPGTILELPDTRISKKKCRVTRVPGYPGTRVSNPRPGSSVLL